MKNKNSKGFSLVEILAAIVILGLLSSIAIVSVNYILNKAETEYYKSQKEQIINAAKSYTQDNRNSLPKRVGMRTEITLSTLQSKKYIGKVVDRHKNECDATETKVQIYKYDKTHYSYSVTLVCPSYKSKGNGAGTNSSNIKFNYDGLPERDEDGNYINIEYKNVIARIEMNDDDKIASYSYIVYKNDAEVKNSGDIEGKLQKTIEIKVPLEKYLPGSIKIKVIVTDFYGEQTTLTDVQEIRSNKAPTCDVLSGENKDWTNTPPIEVSVKCKSNSNKGCQRDIYNQLFSESVKYGTIGMEDKEGNKGDCKVAVFLDMGPPSTPIITNKYNNIWTNESYTIKVTSTDEISGIDHFEYRYPNSNQIASDGKKENEWHSWAKIDDKKTGPNIATEFTSTAFSRERNEVVEVRAVDKAGNYSEKVATTIIKIDKTSPKCELLINPADPNGNNNWYITKPTITISASDSGGSGISSYTLNDGNKSYSQQSATQADTKGTIWTGTVRDAAGNTARCKDLPSIKVDTKAPTIKLS